MKKTVLPSIIPAWCLLGGMIALLLFSGCAVSITEKIVPNSMFRSNMVLQRDMTVPVWGTAQPGQTVLVSFDGQSVAGPVAADGTWSVKLAPLGVSAEPRDFTIEYRLDGAARTKVNLDFGITLHNVLVGEVWYCSGQSNMEMGMLMVADRLEELKDTRYPQIRLYTVVKTASPFPVPRLSSVWLECERENVRQGSWNGFSAVAFYFARKLYKELGVPVGVIESAYGGSAIEPWIPPEEMKITPALQTQYEELQAADAQYADAVKKDPRARHAFADIFEYNQLKPATLYHGMVCPVAPYALRGFIWYQGESNVGDQHYAEKQKALISGWRRVFRRDDAPFYFVQIAPWASYGGTDTLPRFWEQQEKVLEVPHTGMALTADIGMPDNIHPVQKKPVGERLALLALAHDYEKTGLTAEGPVFREMRVERNTAVITFSGAGEGLKSGDGGMLRSFTVAGADGDFHPAQARITGKDTVTVSSPQVSVPAAVRYAWSNTPDPNLYNTEGLPARPFHTDGD